MKREQNVLTKISKSLYAVAVTVMHVLMTWWRLRHQTGGTILDSFWRHMECHRSVRMLTFWVPGYFRVVARGLRRAFRARRVQIVRKLDRELESLKRFDGMAVDEVAKLVHLEATSRALLEKRIEAAEMYVVTTAYLLQQVALSPSVLGNAKFEVEVGSRLEKSLEYIEHLDQLYSLPTTEEAVIPSSALAVYADRDVRQKSIN